MEKNIGSENMPGRKNRSNALSVNRTILANERTLLAYLRTSLTLIVAGISFLHFTESIYVKILSWIFIPSGVIIFIYGFRDFKKRIILIEKGRFLLSKGIIKEGTHSNSKSQ